MHASHYNIDKVQWRHTTPCCRANYVSFLKQSRRSTYSSEHVDRLVLLDSEHRLQILHFSNYELGPTAVADDLLPYNMESETLTIESNSEWHHCRRIYTSYVMWQKTWGWRRAVCRLAYVCKVDYSSRYYRWTKVNGVSKFSNTSNSFYIESQVADLWRCPCVFHEHSRLADIFAIFNTNCSRRNWLSGMQKY